MTKLWPETNRSPSSNAYMKPAFCLVLQQVLGSEIYGSQQILLKTRFKFHQLPSLPNLLVEETSLHSLLPLPCPRKPVCFPSAAAFSPVHVSLFLPPDG